eukprot:CAMPEP_0183819498 /NCGR_PEP_ID=MMETSP0803_2-20130417/64169_1 /TAXON_ID=195967 /ORGANISM="Crustomastix stigmata, Strain CCMP3273" /LENGTH=810 /DNA_ID=CAMNT_0026064387 /DNA_START=237 /DNA_END=2669 /DNA_ORIENTATION=+
MNDILSKDSSHLSILHDLDSYSYGDLSKFSHRVTACIRRYVPSPAEKLAALHIRRCFYFFGCVLGTLRGGMAFCPLNVEDAKARTSRKLKTADPTLIFTDHEMNLSVELNMQTTMLFVADIDGSVTASSSVKVAETCFEPAALCYVIFTSGTTGEPKGVMVESGSVNNMICATISAYELTEHDRVFQFYNLAFDGSIWEYLPTFSVGCTLVLWTPPLENAFSALMKYKVTVFSCTSSVLAICEPETFPHLRCVGQGGEPLTADLVRKWACPKRPLIDSYGPTECCVFITQQRFTEPVETVLLGPAVHNCSTHVLDEDLKEVAVGEEGQLYAGGVHLARGYLHDFKKTEQKFISHPVLGRLYATGDLVRKECGGLKYISRCDSQVKINGFRVELGEITSCLNSCYGVKASAAAVKEGSRLLAYIVWEAIVHDEEVSLLRSLAMQRLQRMLPAYMQPQQLLNLLEIPRTQNGKLDTSRLPDTSERLQTLESKERIRSQVNIDHRPGQTEHECQMILLKHANNGQIPDRFLLLDSPLTKSGKVNKSQLDNPFAQLEESGPATLLSALNSVEIYKLCASLSNSTEMTRKLISCVKNSVTEHDLRNIASKLSSAPPGKCYSQEQSIYLCPNYTLEELWAYVSNLRSEVADNTSSTTLFNYFGNCYMNLDVWVAARKPQGVTAEGGRPGRHFFGVRLVESKKLIGLCGFHIVTPPGVNQLVPTCEIELGFDHSHKGSFGVEAAVKLIDIIFKTTNMHRIAGKVTSTNIPSKSLWDLLGVHEGTCKEVFWNDGQYVDHLHYRILRHEWSSRRHQIRI